MAPLTHIRAVALLISYYTSTILVLGKQTNLKDCLPLRCSKHGPIIRYPLRLHTHAPHCGYDTLVLSCAGDNTVLSLPYSGDFNVTAIDYKNSMLAITRYLWTINCSWSQIAEPYVTWSVFNHPFSVGLSWLDCSDVLTSFSEREYLAGLISCLSYKDHYSYVAWNYTNTDALPSTCTKTRNSLFFTGPKVPHYSLYGTSTPADWFYDPSSPSEFQHMIRDFAERPVIALYWHDELINCRMCEKKWWHRCEFDIETKKSFCRGDLIS